MHFCLWTDRFWKDFHNGIFMQLSATQNFFQEGPPDNPGVNTRALSELFRISEKKAEEVTVQIEVSILEIYNEQIRDLLIAPAKSKDIK